MQHLICLLVVLVAACGTRANPAVCCVSQADCSSLGIDEPRRDCGDGLICLDHACVPPECEVDVDCGGDKPFCAEDRTCVGCRGNADCPTASPICDDATRVCRRCDA